MHECEKVLCTFLRDYIFLSPVLLKSIPFGLQTSNYLRNKNFTYLAIKFFSLSVVPGDKFTQGFLRTKMDMLLYKDP